MLKFQSVHLCHFDRFNEMCSNFRKRKLVTSETPQKQQRVDVIMIAAAGPGNANLVSQHKVDDLVVNFITEGLMPFSVVEMPSFKELVKGLQPNRSVITRPTVMKRVNEKATLVKEQVKTAMAKAQFIATTTDCWSARRRSFVGVTSHWIDDETLERNVPLLHVHVLRVDIPMMYWLQSWKIFILNMIFRGR